jgi:hypothetical protein
MYHAATSYHGVAVGGGWTAVGGQTRYNTQKGYVETYVPSGVVNGRPTGWHWIPMPGQRRETAAGQLQQYFGATQTRDPVTGLMIPRAAGWRAVMTPQQERLQGLQTTASFLSSYIPQLQKQFSASDKNLALMMPADRQKWLQGRLNIDKLQMQQAIDTAEIKAIQKHWSRAQLDKLIEAAKAARVSADTAVKRQAQDALYGGLGKGGYQAYRIIRQDQCQAQAVANVITKKTEKNTASAAKSLANIAEHTAVVAAANKKKAHPPPQKKLPPGHTKGHEPTDERSYGVSGL